MSAIITLLIQLLPIILRLFGLGAAVTAGVCYQRLAGGDPDLALTSAPMAQYVGGWGAASASSFGIAQALRGYLTRRVKGLGDLVQIISEIVQFLSDNPEAFIVIKRILELFKLQGVNVSQVEDAIKQFDPGSGAAK